MSLSKKSFISTTGTLSRLVLLLFVAVLPSMTTASLYDESDGQFVKVFTSRAVFKQEVLQSEGVWMVQFFAPWCGHCKELSTSYKVVAEMTRGIVNVGAVDATSPGGESIASRFKVEAFPTIYTFGINKSKPTLYKGPRNPDAMIQAVMDEAVKTIEQRANDGGHTAPPNGGKQSHHQSEYFSNVVELDDSNFQQEVLDNPKVSMVAFIAPWCGHCKALIPEWQAAARKIEGEDAFLAVVDATVETNLAQMYKVEGFPTIKVFPGGKNKSHMDAMDYRGERSSSAIVDFILAEVDRTGVPKIIPELISADILAENCKGTNRLCVLAALPHILDSSASGRNKYRDTLTAIQKRFRGSAFNFLWFEGSSQPDLEKEFDLTFGFPALVALSYDKQAYAVLRGSFQEKSVVSFLHAITSGRQSTTKMSNGIPKVVTMDPWDGLDGALPEEEFDLADIMGWDEKEEEKEGNDEL